MGVFSFALGSLLLVFVCASLLIAAVCFGLGFSLSGLPLAAGAGVATVYGGWICARSAYSRAPRVRSFALVMLAAIAVCAASLAASEAFYDLSFDGQAYHQEAIIRLQEGWNPYTEPTRFPDASTLLWVNHYPKASWINAAALSLVTNRVESGKAFNLVLIVASCCLALVSLARATSLTWHTAVPIALLASLNPVSIYQALSFYVDGQLASLLVILAALSALWLARRDRIALLLLMAALVTTINVKFTGLVYGAILGAGVMIGAAMVLTRRLAVMTSGAVATAAVVGVLLVGYNPYTSNIINNGHIFYPLNGEIGTRVSVADRPVNFQPLNRFRKLFHSVFSASQQAPEPSRLKIPFTVTRAELTAFRLPDVRIGGFGPLFGGAMILAAVILAGALLQRPRIAWVAAAVVVWILVSTCINPEAWWARFAPQMWLIPLVAAIAGFAVATNRWLPALSYGLVAILFANVMLIAVPYARHQSLTTRALHRQLAELAARPERPLISFDYFWSNRVRLREAGVEYRDIDRARCIEPVNLVSSTTTICAGLRPAPPR